MDPKSRFGDLEGDRAIFRFQVHYLPKMTFEEKLLEQHLRNVAPQ